MGGPWARSSESINRNRSLGLFTGHTLFLCCARLRKACTHVSPRKLWTVTKEGSEIAIRLFLVKSNLVRLGKASSTNWTRPCALVTFLGRTFHRTFGSPRWICPREPKAIDLGDKQFVFEKNKFMAKKPFQAKQENYGLKKSSRLRKKKSVAKTKSSSSLRKRQPMAKRKNSSVAKKITVR